ncbi:MAG: M14 family zinc carboxypeptidase [Cytophagales bacterium]|nr:M14 family zinc carboxypeptidase [Bernardetiaceae bacterium]MDW8209629.1 M14 family zinc carboxypeptidase [Cytophagales bacterium]
MKKQFFYSVWLAGGLWLADKSYAQELSYYLPDSIKYNAAIPTPEVVMGHKFGQWHMSHDKMVYYLRALAAASNRVKLEEFGYTYEGRPQLLLIITSPKNQANLENLRREHLKLTDPTQSNSLSLENMPVVVWLAATIHGNEQSGVGAMVLTAYHLAAAQNIRIEEMLDKMIILMEPCQNPDGMNRFSTWVNMHKSIGNTITDPAAREFNEVWPSARTNHYWFDLNRDWLPAQHLESRNRLVKYHQWKPNVVADQHEMGTNATYFFMPGEPIRTNPITPPINQEITARFARYHASFMNRIQSLYYTKEGFDDFYYGKGSTYPDGNGAIGILFEQASSRGHAQESDNGVLTYPFTIRNQLATCLSTLQASYDLRVELLRMQRDFFQSAISEAASSPIKGYAFGDAYDRVRTHHFVELLRRHQIEVYQLKSRLQIGGQTFDPTTAYIVPTAQPQYRLIRAIFEKTTGNYYKDSLFYDVTTWTMPLAFGLSYAEIRTPINTLLGNKIEGMPTMPKGEVIGGVSSYAYIFEYDEYYAPQALYEVLSKNLIARVAAQPFEIQTAEGTKRRFNTGAIVVMAGSNLQSTYDLMKNIAAQTGVNIYAVNTGLAEVGPDLGGRYFQKVRKPVILLFGGQGTNSYDVGEIWYLLDSRFRIPVTIVDLRDASKANLDRYNVIIMANGNYSEVGQSLQNRLKNWVQNGGTLLAIEEAVSWAVRNGLTEAAFKQEKRDSTQITNLPYGQLDNWAGAQQMSGSIFEARLDLTHPLAYGYRSPSISLFKNNKLFLKKGNNAAVNPIYYGENPLQSGYVSKQNYEQIKNSAVLHVSAQGRGRVISMTDSPNFRAFWYGGTKLFMNAIFFGNLIRTSFGNPITQEED